MPRKSSENKGGYVRDTYDLSNPPLLDVASRLWNLPDGTASDVLGLDVIRRGRYRPERGRVPVELFLTAGEQAAGPITSVFEVNSDTLVPTRIQGKICMFRNSTGAHTGTAPIYNEIQINEITSNYDNDTGNLSGVHSNLVDAIDQTSPARMALIESSDGSHTISGAYALRSSPLRTDTGLLGGSGTEPVTVMYFPNDVHFPSPCIQTYGEYGITKSYTLYQKEGAWDPEIVGANVVINADLRVGNGTTTSDGVVRLKITGLETMGQTNNTLLLGTDHDPAKWNGSKFYILYKKPSSLKGIVVSNGRTFWLYSGGTKTQIMDMGSNDYIGAVWKSSRIAANRYLLTCPDFHPRVLRLNQEATTDIAGEDSFAGLLPPNKPADVESYENVSVSLDTNTGISLKNPSWFAKADNTPGDLAGSPDIQALVRLVNYEESLFSHMVPVWDSDDISVPYDNAMAGGVSLDINTISGGIVGIFENRFAGDNPTDNNFGWSPYISPRATALEIWRTQAGGGTYHLESFVELCGDWYNETVIASTGDNVVGRLGLMNYISNDGASPTGPITLADEDLAGLPALTDENRFVGGLPPVCKESISLQGVTICAGKAGASVPKATIYAKNFCTATTEAVFNGPSHVSPNRLITTAMTSNFVPPGDIFENYTFKSGDRLVVRHTGTFSSTTVSIPEGTYDIVAKHANDILEVTDWGTGSQSTATTVSQPCQFFIERPYEIEYPEIESDEDIWYSRTVQFSPETFPARIVTVSRIGDTFRKIVNIGRYAAIIMDQGVHLLYFDSNIGAELQQDTIAEAGFGTPWGDSVVKVGNQVMWASVDGIRVLSTTNAPGVNGTRAQLSLLDDGRFSDWFQDALDDGDVIDAGFDPSYSCIRFRRNFGSNTFTTLQYSLRTRLWTFLDDDAGAKYAQSSFVESSDLQTPALYSVELGTGALFRVNYEGADPYSGITTSGTLSDMTAYSPTSVTDTGNLDSKLVGSVIRFTTSGVDTLRIILTASSNTITFASVGDLVDTTTFIIESIRFRVTYAPALGRDNKSAKTLSGVRTRFRAGERTTSGDTLTIKSYEDYGTASVDTDTIDIYSPGETGKTDIDRVSPLTAQGYAIGIEIEKLNARSDFEVELFDVLIDEEANTVIDQDST